MENEIKYGKFDKNEIAEKPLTLKQAWLSQIKIYRIFPNFFRSKTPSNHVISQPSIKTARYQIFLR